jgi:carboxyl-terminal processing protease
MNRKILSAVFSLLVFVITTYGSIAGRLEHKPIKPEEQHPIVMQAVAQLVSQYHYHKLGIDDQFSAKLLDNYVKHLDGGKVYFTEADIKSFEKYRYAFDDMIFGNNVQPAFDMYNLLLDRMTERCRYAKQLLKHDFDYSTNDSFMIDREKAPWCKNTGELDKLWASKIKYECLSIRSTGKDYKSYSETIRKRYDNLEKQISKTKSEDIFSLFMNSMAELADPHTNYFSPRIAEDFNNSMSLSLEGIGAQLQTDGEHTKVTMIIKGGPADSSKKLFENDKIIGVAQGHDSEIVNVIDWRIDDVVALIRGKKGTLVKLEIIPANEPTKTRIIELIRDKIKLEDQASKGSIKEVEANGRKFKVGVITIPTFYIDFAAMQRGDPNYTSTTRDAKRLISELRAKGAEGIVIDLRNNGGGSLQEAIELTGLFIKKGAVVQVKDASGSIKAEKDNDSEVYYEGPLTVLVNRFSASASEIFAAAIQDYGRGVIMGERTFGKGTVQNVMSLNDMIRMNDKTLGQVKITIAKFYRINGSSTQHKGVTPDIEFPGAFDDDKYGEDASEFALPWDQISATSYESLGLIGGAKQELLRRHEVRMQGSQEYKYLLEDLAYLKKMEASNYVTLNEKKFKEQNEASEKIKKHRDEERKASHRESKDDKDIILSESEMLTGDLLNMKVGMLTAK